MNRRFWARVMVFSFFLTLFSGGFLAMRLKEDQTREVPLVQTEETSLVETESPDAGSAMPPEPEAESKDAAGEDLLVRKVGETAGEEKPAEKPAPAKTTEKKIASPASSGPARNILFAIHTSASRVAIIGDFNDWFRTPLENVKGNRWEAAVQIPPGRYEYLYVVDDRRIKDPNNEKSTEDGKSILVVKPLTQ